MSLVGWREAQLERERIEELRLDGVRREVREILQDCERAIGTVRDVAVQQLAAEDLRSVRDQFQEAAGSVASAPDESLKLAHAARKKLHRCLADAERAAQKWTKEQAEAKARLSESQAQAAASNVTATSDGSAATALVESATSLYRQGRFREAISVCDKVEVAVQNARQAAFDETVRREVVRGLLATLSGMGFVTESPILNRKQDDAGVVTLVGRLPSGRMARFEVHVDGRMSFDFDGYQERECGKDLEKISKTLNERFGVRLGPAQVTWKNPDRIAKGARTVPFGNTGVSAR